LSYSNFKQIVSGSSFQPKTFFKPRSFNKANQLFIKIARQTLANIFPQQWSGHGYDPILKKYVEVKSTTLIFLLFDTNKKD